MLNNSKGFTNVLSLLYVQNNNPRPFWLVLFICIQVKGDEHFVLAEL